MHQLQWLLTLQNSTYPLLAADPGLWAPPSLETCLILGLGVFLGSVVMVGAARLQQKACCARTLLDAGERSDLHNSTGRDAWHGCFLNGLARRCCRSPLHQGAQLPLEQHVSAKTLPSLTFPCSSAADTAADTAAVFWCAQGITGFGTAILHLSTWAIAGALGFESGAEGAVGRKPPLITVMACSFASLSSWMHQSCSLTCPRRALLLLIICIAVCCHRAAQAGGHHLRLWHDSLHAAHVFLSRCHHTRHQTLGDSHPTWQGEPRAAVTVRRCGWQDAVSTAARQAVSGLPFSDDTPCPAANGNSLWRASKQLPVSQRAAPVQHQTLRCKLTPADSCT